MNKVFRVIWSQATQSWVAVSELTKAHKKQSSSNSLKAALGAATVLLSINSAEASVLIGATENNTETVTKIKNQDSNVYTLGITIGGGIKAGDESVHIGDYSGSVGSRNVVIGTNASAGYDDHDSTGNPPRDAGFNQSVAIGSGRKPGEGARAYGDQSIAIGSNTIARGNSSIAIGNDDVDKTGSTDTTYTDLNGQTKTGSIANAYKELTGQDLGLRQYQDTTSKEAAVAIGVKSVAGDISLALGTAARADKVNAVAIGTGATANRDNAVAIGGGATTDKEGTKEVNATINDLKFTWKGGENTLAGDIVSFGKEGFERQLKHVAAGRVAEDSTDAINGSQFFGILKHLTADPVYFYGADDSTAGKIEGVEAEAKSADALKKKVVAKSMADSRLNLRGGADKDKLSENNIGVTYEDTSSIRFRLSKELAGLTSAEFKDANNNVANITPTRVSFKKPNAPEANTVKLSQDGLNNGGNAITNVAGNLQGSKASSTAPTTSATAPTLGTGTNEVNKNNVATVGDVLEAGWNLQNNGNAKDLVKPYDTVNFADGNGTTAVVDTTDNETSTVKYNVNLGNGLDKTKDNKITVKPADKSLEVNKDGVKVKTDGTTITTDENKGLKVVTGSIEAGTNPGTVKVTDGDNDKIATVDSVVNAVNKAAFTLKASAGGGTRNGNSTVNANGEPIKAGSTIEMIAGKNLDVKHDKNGKITFATVDNPSFDTVQVGNSEGPKFSATTEGNISVSDKDGTKPVKITNVKDGEISANSKDAINGSQFHKVANNTIKLAGQNGDDTATATETNAQNLNKQGGIKFTVKSSDGTLLDVAATGDTITLTPKTATLTADKNGVPQANTTDGKLVTADDLVKALTKMGWKATAGNDGTGTVDNATSELIKAGETVTFKAGDNLAVKQAGKEFIYSLQKKLTGLTSAEFKGTDANAPTTKLTNAGVTITPATSTGKKPVSLTENGLDNGGNPITNVAGNLDGAKTGTNAPTTSATKPTLGTAANEVNSNNAATVGDVLNAGWNLQEKGTAKDFVTAYDTVNFVDGDGTSVSVTTTTDGKTSTIKYSANLGDGLEKTNDNKIKVKAADKSLEVTNEGVKVKAADNTLTTDTNGLKVNTGTINPVDSGDKAGTVEVNTNDAGKIATVDTVVNAVNNAAWNATAAKTNDGENGGTVKKQAVKAGDTVTFEADKNIKIAQAEGKFTFSTKDNVEFTTVKVGDTANGKKPVELKNGDVITANNNPEQPTTALNVSSDGKPTQITGVGSVLNTTPVTTMPDGSALAKQSNVVNLGTAHGQTALDNSVLNAAATVRDLANMGWKISSDNATGADGKDYSDVVRNADEVKFVGKNAAKVSGKTENGVRTITVDVEVPDVKTAELVSSEDGSVIAPSTDSKLQEALKAAKDELAALPKDATPEKKKEAENKVKAAETALSNAVDNKGVATAKNVADMINKSGFTLKTSEAEGGKKDTTSSGDEVINPGKAVEMVAGKNLTVKQEENGKVTYSLNPVLTGLTSAEFKGTAANAPTTILNNSGITITKPADTAANTPEKTVTLNQDGLNNGGNAITNVAGNLDGAKTGTTAPTTSATKPTLGTAANEVNSNNAATVGDVLNAGWNLQEKGTAKDFVTAYDTVNFVDGDGTSVSVENKDKITSTIKYSVNLGDGLEKTDDNKIKAKAGDGVTVGADGIKVNTGKGLKIDATDGNKVAVDTDGTTITVGDDGKVKAVTGSTEEITADNKTGTEKVGQVRPVEADKGKLATVDAVANAVNSAKWMAKATNTDAEITDTDKTNDTTGEGIAAGDEVTFTAGKNLRVKRDGKNFTFATDKDVSFDSVKVGAEDKTANGKKPVNLTTQAATTANNNEAGKEPTTALNISSGTDAKPTQLVGVGSVLNKETINTTPTGTVPAGNKPTTADLVDLKGTDAAPVNKNAAATVGDLANMGWKVSSDKTTGAEGAYLDVVKNANEVKFVGEGTAVVSGKTDGNVRTITVKVDDQVSTNNAVTPVVYTKADGTKVYPVKNAQGDIEYHTTPDGKGEGDQKVDDGDVITSVNGPEGTTKPTTLSNVAGNLNGAKKDTTAPTNEAAKPDNADTIKNNAATVGDVLNAGWNLQNNGTARDFVKPFDTVNFVNGVNTTAVVTTSEDGTTSNVTYNVTGLPVTYTTADGTPVSKIGDKFYKVNDKGQPVDEQGNPSTKVNNNGEPIDDNGNVIKPVDTSKNPLSTNLVNPNVTNTATEPNKKTTSPTQLGNVTSGLQKYGDQVNGADLPGTNDKNRGLVDLSKPTTGEPKVSDNTAATVGDLRNMGWIVSADKTTGDLTKTYSDTVKNANEVKFVGEGTATVTGKTDDKGVRTITVKVDDQVSTNNAIMPTSFTTKDGKKVYPVKDDKGNVTYHTTPDGKGTPDNPDTVVNEGDVVTSVNGPKGTTTPTTLQNVKSNLPNVDDKKQKAFNPDGTEVTEPDSTTNTGNAKAPLSHTVVAAMMSPFMTNEEGNFIDENGNVTTDPKKYVRNPNFAANNAATVGDVLSAGWNLQNNGAAKDFVKPYDTVNFINGLGTTAVVTTREGNTTSDVTFNVKAANGSVTVDEDGVKVTTGEMKPAVDANNKETGAIATPADPTTAKQLKDTLDAAVKELATAKDALKTAETALAANPKDPALQKAVEDKKAEVAAKQTPVNEAQKAHDDAGLNKIATVQNVAEAINNAGFNLETSADGGEKLTTGTKNDGELIKPGNTVKMVAGNNLTVKQDADGKITYATKDEVTFKTVDTGTLTVGNPNTYTDGKGNTYTKVGENYYNPADVENGALKPGVTPATIPGDAEMKPVSPVTMKAEAAKPATNNATDAQPSSALNVTSKDGKPTQITGVGSTLNTKSVDTTPAGTAPGTTPNTTPANLIDLEGTADAPVNKNAAATVGDLQNMGWVVSAKDGNGYKDVVKNANVVDFKGDQGVTVTGKTLADGTREITVGIKEGEVTNKVTITHGDGSKTDAVKIGDNYYKVDKDGKPVGYEKGKDGKPAGTPLNVDPNTDKVTNAGAGVVTGNAVANAIQDSGWNVGIGSTDKDFSKDAKVYDKVNPNDDVKFSNGANTNVSMVTVDALNEDGTKKATTYVKVDINRDLKIDSVTTGGTATDKNGNNLVKVGDQYYKEGDVTIVTNPDGTTTVTPKENAKAVPPADVIPAKDGAMIVKNADGKDVVSATVGKDGNGAFGINGKDGKNGISMTAKDGQGTIGVNGKDGKSTTIAGDTITIKDKDNNATNIGVNTITLVDKAGNTTTTTADKSEIKDAAGNINANTATGNTLKDPNGNTHTSTASTSELKDKDGNTNTSTPTTNVLKDTNGNTNTSAATGTTYKDKDENKTVVGPKEINISDKSGENTASLTNKDLLLNAKDPNTGVDKTSHVSGDKIAFTTTDEMEKVVDKDGKPVIDPATGKQKEVVKMEKVFDKDGKPVIDPATGKQKEVVKNPGNSTEYTNEGLKVIPNSTVARDVNGNPTFLDKDGKPVMKDTDGKYKYVGQDGKPGDKYDGSVGALKPNVVDNTRVISFGMDKPVLDKNGKPVTGPDGNPVMTEGISAGMQRVHNVAPGRISPTSTDAVNGSQLYAVASNIGNLNNKINKVGKRGDAGIASALAAANIPQAYTPGKSLVGIAAGSYQGQNGLAVGMSRISDNGKIIIRLSGTANSQGKTGVAAGVGYQW